jgi:O-antigen ligase
MQKLIDRLARLSSRPIDGGVVRMVGVIFPVIYILLAARLVVVTLLVTPTAGRALIALWITVCLFFWRRRPLYPVLISLVLAPVISFWQLNGVLGWYGWPSSPFLPFACASSGWLARWLFSPDERRRPFTLAGWLAECLALLVIVKMVVGFMTPSPINALWRLVTVPDDLPFTEIQGMSTGFFLLSMLVLFRIIVMDARRSPRASKLLVITALVQFSLVAVFAFSQVALAVPPLEREGLHAPFFGIHEMGFYAACFLSFTSVALISDSRLRTLSPWRFRAVLFISFLLLVFSGSKSAWLAVLVGVLVGVANLGPRLLLRALLLLCAALALSFSTIALLQSLDSTQKILPSRLQFLAGGSAAFGGKADQDRWSLLAKAFILAKERPLDGVGIGDFRISETDETLRATRELPQDKRNHSDSHNVFVHFLVETGLGGLFLFAFLAFFSVMSGFASRVSGLAAGGSAAVVAALITNCFNDVLSWPWQALTFGFVLSLPFAFTAEKIPQVPLNGKSSPVAVLPLVPVLLALILAPWSVDRDLRLQGRSFGASPRTIFSRDFAVFEAQPCGMMELPPNSPARFLEIRAAPDLPFKRRIFLSLTLNGKTLAENVSCGAPRRFELHGQSSQDRSQLVEWSTDGLTRLWRRSPFAPCIWWIAVLDEQGNPLAPEGLRLGGRWP